MSNIDRKDLLARAVAGDSAALGELLQHHSPHIARELRRDHAALSAADIEDVMQVTFLEAFLHIRRFDTASPGSLGGWLRSIARNNVSDLIRERERAKRLPEDRRVQPSRDASYTALLDNLSRTASTPSQVTAAAEATTLVEEAVERLPESYRQVVRLYDLDGRTVDDVAQVLGRSAGAVFMLRARAHERLRELLGSESRFFSRGA